MRSSLDRRRAAGFGRAAHGAVAVALSAALSAALGCSSASDAGTTPVAPPSDSHGVVETDSFSSAALGVTKQYLVYLPPSYASQPQRRYPVLYLLHGSPGTQRDWVDALQVNVVLDSLAAAGLPEAIAVMPDGDSWFYHDWAAVPPACSGQPYSGEMPSEPCVPGQKYAYGTYMTRDLIARIDGTYRTQADAAHRGIAGVSMGGYGAAYLSLAHPELYAVGVPMSGARLNFLEMPGGAGQATSLVDAQVALGTVTYQRFLAEYGGDFANWRASDPYTMVLLARQAGRAVPPQWVIVGASDALHPQSEQLDRALTQAGIPHVFSEPAGDHSGTFWRAHEGAALAWALQHIGS
jgi:S-formylglutathione hydrolase FrmB